MYWETNQELYFRIKEDHDLEILVHSHLLMLAAIINPQPYLDLMFLIILQH